MFNREQKTRRISAKISEEKIREIKIYIISAVRTFCANNLEGDGTSQWFAVHTFFGDKNYYWIEPLSAIYNYYVSIGKTQEKAVLQAGRDIGILLKQVLKDDDRIYVVGVKQRRFTVNKYKCIDFNL